MADYIDTEESSILAGDLRLESPSSFNAAVLIAKSYSDIASLPKSASSHHGLTNDTICAGHETLWTSLRLPEHVNVSKGRSVAARHRTSGFIELAILYEMQAGASFRQKFPTFRAAFPSY